MTMSLSGLTEQRRSAEQHSTLKARHPWAEPEHRKQSRQKNLQTSINESIAEFLSLDSTRDARTHSWLL